MARSRYASNEVLDDNHFASWRLPVRSAGLRPPDLLEGVRTFEHVLQRGERADQLAARFLNDEAYWWVIALVNGVSYPFQSGGWTAGRSIVIPYNVQDVLDKLR